MGVVVAAEGLPGLIEAVALIERGVDVGLIVAGRTAGLQADTRLRPEERHGGNWYEEEGEIEEVLYVC